MLTTGALLVCVAILALAAAAQVFRRSDPPAWTTRRWAGELVTLAIVCTLAIGLGYFGAGVIDAVQMGPGYVDLIMVTGVLLVTVAIWRQWKRRARALEAGAGMHPAVARPTAAPGGRQMTAPGSVAAVQAPPPHRAA